MFIFHLFKHLYPKGAITISIPYPTPKSNPFLSTFSSKFGSITTQQNSFTVSYLINNRKFSPETALKASRLVRFDTTQKPDSVIAFFRSHGFSDSQINDIVRKAPNVLTCDPNKRVLPKFEFLRSKGASSSEIVELVNRSPRILYSSLQNSVIPTFELVRRFLQSDKKTIDCILTCRSLFGNNQVVQNVRLLLDDGVKDSNITYVLVRRPYIFMSSGMRKIVDELKEMRFDTSKINFAIALLAKTTISKSLWDSKVVVFKSWGWSEELVLDVFRRFPLFMLTSKDKVNNLMKFWVDQLGWDSLALAKKPLIFGFSLEKRIIPRALIVQYLLAKGLREKNASLFTPFVISEKAFLERYVKRFKVEEGELLKLYYQEKMTDTC